MIYSSFYYQLKNNNARELAFILKEISDCQIERDSQK